jgi:small subunit ribosomal protein S7e
MLQGAKKIVKKDGSAPSELEQRVANEIQALENNNAALKAELSHLHISAAREVETEGGKKAIIVFVPCPLLGDFRKIQKTLIEELEKKFGGQHVLLFANRTMVSPETWSRSDKYSGVRPRSRSLKNVQEALLDDLVFPTEIVGKRTRVRLDGSRITKVHLNPKDQVAVEGKVDTFRSVYKRLTNKEISFVF